MTDQRELDRLLGAFLAEDTGELPDRVIDAALEQIDHTPQRHAVRMPWRLPRMNIYTRLAAAAILGLVAVGGSLYLAGLRQHQVIGPSPTSSASASPSESAHPHAAVYVFTKGAGSAAECGGSRGGCIPRLWVANLDGSGAHELLPDQSGCQRFQAWSPDGTRLLFTRSECRWNGEAGLIGLARFYLTAPTGSQPQLVDTGCVDLCVSENDAVFSADGLQILFVRTRSIPPAPSATDPVNGKPAQGSEVRVLASIDIATSRVTELGDFDECPQRCASGPPRSDPIWSPDRTQILYTWKPQTVGPQPNAGSAVLVADADGRNVLQLSASGGAPAWSPDGTRIAFRSERYSWKGTWKPGVVQHPFFDIYTIRPDGTELVRLTSDEVSLNPEWSPDGRIWFIKVINPLNGDEPAQFWVMDADGSHATQTNPPPEQAWFLQPTP